MSSLTKALGCLIACAFMACSTSVWAQAPAFEGDPQKIAQSVVDDAMRLADVLDIAREDASSPKITLGQALLRAKELAPKALMGMGPWKLEAADPLAQVEEPTLCRALANICAQRESGNPGLCSCRPTGAGAFEFSFWLEYRR